MTGKKDGQNQQLITWLRNPCEQTSPPVLEFLVKKLLVCLVLFFRQCLNCPTVYLNQMVSGWTAEVLNLQTLNVSNKSADMSFRKRFNQFILATWFRAVKLLLSVSKWHACIEKSSQTHQAYIWQACIKIWCSLDVKCICQVHSLLPLLQVYTRYGKCYTFNGNKTTAKRARQGGMGNGLEMMLDIEQDEYLPIWRETSEHACLISSAIIVCI